MDKRERYIATLKLILSTLPLCESDKELNKTKEMLLDLMNTRLHNDELSQQQIKKLSGELEYMYNEILNELTKERNKLKGTDE